MNTEEQLKVVAERYKSLLKKLGHPDNDAEGAEFDVEYFIHDMKIVEQHHGLDLEFLMKLPDKHFFKDLRGIEDSLVRSTGQFLDGFKPRCVKR